MERYTGQLENVDAFEYGVQLRRKNEPCFDYENDLTNLYNSNNEKDIDFLNDWHEKMVKGWRKEDSIISEKRFKDLLVEFKKVIPKVGEILYVEHPNNLGVYYKCLIEFVPDEMDKVLVRYLDSKAGTYGQSKLSLLDYSYSSKYKNAIFPIFHKEKPIKE